MDKFIYKNKIKLLNTIKNILVFATLNFSFLLYFSTKWLNKNIDKSVWFCHSGKIELYEIFHYNKIKINKIIFNMYSNIKNFDFNRSINFIKNVIIPTLFLSILLFVIYIKISKNIIKNKNFILPIKKFGFKNTITLLERKKEYILSLIFFRLKFLIIIKRKIIFVFITMLYLILILACINYSVKI